MWRKPVNVYRRRRPVWDRALRSTQHGAASSSCLSVCARAAASQLGSPQSKQVPQIARPKRGRALVVVGFHFLALTATLAAIAAAWKVDLVPTPAALVGPTLPDGCRLPLFSAGLAALEPQLLVCRREPVRDMLL